MALKPSWNPSRFAIRFCVVSGSFTIGLLWRYHWVKNLSGACGVLDGFLSCCPVTCYLSYTLRLKHLFQKRDS